MMKDSTVKPISTALRQLIENNGKITDSMRESHFGYDWQTNKKCYVTTYFKKAQRIYNVLVKDQTLIKLLQNNSTILYNLNPLVRFVEGEEVYWWQSDKIDIILLYCLVKKGCSTTIQFLGKDFPQLNIVSKYDTFGKTAMNYFRSLSIDNDCKWIYGNFQADLDNIHYKPNEVPTWLKKQINEEGNDN